jgi:hypothetical protein
MFVDTWIFVAAILLFPHYDAHLPLLEALYIAH